MPTFRSLTFALACVALLPAKAAAQDTAAPHRTVGSGFTFQDDSRVTRRGVHVEGAYAVPLIGRRLEGRLEGGVHYFPGSSTGMMCAPFTVCDGTASKMTVLRGGASLVFIEQIEARGAFYWIAGLGVYRVTDRPLGDPYTRPGWNAGFGVRFGRSAFGEFRYHEASGTQPWRHLVPLTFGVRF